jgi:hypothetical protein
MFPSQHPRCCGSSRAKISSALCGGVARILLALKEHLAALSMTAKHFSSLPANASSFANKALLPLSLPCSRVVPTVDASCGARHEALGWVNLKETADADAIGNDGDVLRAG